MFITAKNLTTKIVANVSANHGWAQLESDLAERVREGESVFSIYVREDDGADRFYGVVDRYGYSSAH